MWQGSSQQRPWCTARMQLSQHRPPRTYLSTVWRCGRMRVGVVRNRPPRGPILVYRPVGPSRTDSRRLKRVASRNLPVRLAPCRSVTNAGRRSALARLAVLPGARGRQWTGPGLRRTPLRPSSLWSCRTQQLIGSPHLALPAQGPVACSLHMGRHSAAVQLAASAPHRPSWVSATAWWPLLWHHRWAPDSRP